MNTDSFLEHFRGKQDFIIYNSIKFMDLRTSKSQEEKSLNILSSEGIFAVPSRHPQA